MCRALSWFTAAAAAAAAVIAALLIVIGGPVGDALAAAPTQEAFTVGPAPAADGQPRGYFQLSAVAGGSLQDVVAFGNTGAVTERLRVGVTDGTTATDSGSAYGPLTSNCAGTACWVTGIPPTITLAPHTQEEVKFQVNVPGGTRPAQYLAGISATRDAASPPVPTASGARTQVTIVPRVVIGVAVTVGGLATLTSQAEITGATAGWVDGIVRLTVAVHNSGQRFTKGTGVISCGMDGATHSFGLSMDTVLPGQGAGLPINATSLRQGTWQCSGRLKAADGGTTSWTGTVVVPSTVPAATKRIASNDYVVPASPGIPLWAVGLMIIGGLILISIWVVFLRRGRNRNRNTPAGS
jgi:hypothetical protein